MAPKSSRTALITNNKMTVKIVKALLVVAIVILSIKYEKYQVLWQDKWSYFACISSLKEAWQLTPLFEKIMKKILGTNG